MKVAGGLNRRISERQTIPRPFGTSLCATVLIAGTLSVPNLGGASPLPATILMDVWIVGFMAYCFLRGRIEAWTVLMLVVAYSLTRVIPAIRSDAPLFDFAKAYRWVLYLMAFALAVGRVWSGIKPLIVTTWLLIGMAFVKAAATFVVVGPGERPGLLLENNFELALFAGLVAVIYRHLRGSRQLWMMALLGGLTVLSGSRSGTVSFFVLVVFAVTQRKSSFFVQYLSILAIPITGFVTLSVFKARGPANRVDRLWFLEVFLAETVNWTPVQWIFGTTPITPLSYGACAELSFYRGLLASAGDGSCYSVILHAFIMRVVFDAGILGLALCLVVAWYAMSKGGVARGVTITLLGIAFANGLSVSGLNNPYVALPIILAIVTAKLADSRPDRRYLGRGRPDRPRTDREEAQPEPTRDGSVPGTPRHNMSSLRRGRAHVHVSRSR
jgi:hypothetical protein